MEFDDVVVLAHHYPYWLGPTAETYLEGEMRVISEHAKRLHVAAFENVFKGAPLRKNLPKGLNIVTIAGEDMRLECGRRRRWHQLKAVLSEEFLLDLRKINSKDRLVSFTYFIRTSNMIADAAWSGLKNQCPEFGTGKTLIYSFWFNEPSRAAVLLAKKMVEEGLSRPVLVARAHGYDCYDYRSELDYLPCKEWMAKNIDAIYPCSLDGLKYLSERNPRVANKFRVIHLGTDDYGLGPTPSGNGIHVVTCSRAVPLKRLDRVACCIAELQRRGIDVRWTCIGDGETLESAKSQVNDLGIADRVVFKGALSRDQVYAYYRSTPVDVFVNASEVEGIPLSIMEALSFGIPAVATKVGGNPEIVEDGVNGYVVPRDFSDGDLCGAILALCDNGRSVYRENARKVWENAFSLQRNAERLLTDAFEFMTQEKRLA